MAVSRTPSGVEARNSMSRRGCPPQARGKAVPTAAGLGEVRSPAVCEDEGFALQAGCARRSGRPPRCLARAARCAPSEAEPGRGEPRRDACIALPSLVGVRGHPRRRTHDAGLAVAGQSAHVRQASQVTTEDDASTLEEVAGEPRTRSRWPRCLVGKERAGADRVLPVAAVMDSSMAAARPSAMRGSRRPSASLAINNTFAPSLAALVAGKSSRPSPHQRPRLPFRCLPQARDEGTRHKARA